MHVMHVIHSLDPRSGGPAESLRALAVAQRRAGMAVSLACTDVQSAEPWAPDGVYRQSLVRWARRHDIALALHAGLGRRGALRRWRHCPGAARWARDLMGGGVGVPDVVHVHGLFFHLGAVVATAAMRMDVPVVLRPAGGLNAACLGAGNSPGKKLLLAMGERRRLAGAAALHATSPREAAVLHGLFPRTRVIECGHGVRVPSAAVLERCAARFLAAHPELERGRFVLYLSRLAPKKRADLLVEAFAGSRLRKAGWRLCLAGPDAGGRAAAAAAADRVGLGDIVWTGHLGAGAKWGALAAAGVFCLPSIDENFGLAVVEALAAGAPVVTTTGVDSSAHVAAAEAGMVVDCHIDALAVALDRMHDADRASMGGRGRRHAAQALGWDQRAGQLAAVYQELIRDDAP